MRRLPSSNRGLQLAFWIVVLGWGIQVGAVSAQERTHYTVSGTLTDSTTGEVLVGAAVQLLNTPDAGVISNQYGFFHLNLPSDSVSLLVTHIGYRPLIVQHQLRADARLDLALVPAPLELETVEIVATSESIARSTQMSRITLPLAQIEALPVLAGETDVLKILQLLPGVASGTEGGAGIYVRGGGPDQNLFLLDGVPIYNPSHLFGFLGTFNGDAIKDVALFKGGFPARYGGRLSSVVDLTLKEGNLKEYAGGAAIGLIASRAFVEGPIRRDRASFFVAARRTYLDLLARPFMPANERGGYFFHDVNAKANWIVTPRDRLYLSMYSGLDRVWFRYQEDYASDLERGQDRVENKLDWTNTVATLRWNRVLGPRWFANTTAGFTRYRLYTGGEVTTTNNLYYYRATYESGITDAHVRSDFEARLGRNHAARFGAGLVWHDFLTGAFSERIEDVDEPPVDTVYTPNRLVNGVEMLAYAEDEFHVHPQFRVNVGIHTSGFLVEQRAYWSAQPRVSLWAGIGRNSSLKASLAMMRQYIHLLTTYSGLSLPTDLWVPATERIRPQHAVQGAVGFAHSLRNGRVDLSVEGFYKQMRNLIEYREAADYFDAAFSNWQDKVVSGRGRAYGGELFVHKKTGRNTGWVGYTLSWSERTFDEINQGLTFPYRYDRRHDVSVAVSHAFSRHVRVGATWVYGTGQAITLPVGHLAGEPEHQWWRMSRYIPLYRVLSGRNGARTPAYHRMDVVFHFDRDKGWADRTMSVGLYNAYRRLNAFSVYATRANNSDDLVFKQISLLPIVPAISYQLRF